MPLHIEDLPPKLRSRVEAKVGKQATGHQRNRSEAKGAEVPYRCHDCSEEFPKFSGKGGAEEHARATGHVRQEMVLA